MKKKKIVFMLLLLGILLSEFPFAQTSAAKKKKTEICRLDDYAIQSNKQYTIRDVIKIKRKPDSYDKAEKKKFTDFRIKWKSGSKHIRIKKNRFTVKKPGKYELTGKLKEKKKDSEFTIVLRVLDKLPGEIPDDVSKITISRFGNAITIILPQEISLLRQRFSLAAYRLDLNLSNRMYCGGEYSIKAYSSEEEVVFSFIIMDSSLISTSGGSYCSTGNNSTKQYVEELYNKYYDPEAKEG